MGAPSPTARQSPAGIKIDDGFSTLITFAANPTVSLWEKTVKPPGIDGGDAIETTTMHNVTWRTMSPRQLKTLTECSFEAAYDPRVYDQLVSLINVETVITVEFSDNSELSFHGYLKGFEPGDCVEGEQPTGTATIVPTNMDTGGGEYGPNYQTPTGTD